MEMKEVFVFGGCKNYISGLWACGKVDWEKSSPLRVGLTVAWSLYFALSS